MMNINEHGLAVHLGWSWDGVGGMFLLLLLLDCE